MATMVRKQVYIEPCQDELLKQCAGIGGRWVSGSRMRLSLSGAVP